MDEYEDETQNADPGTAFPIVHPDGRGVQCFGLTMRDYFAAKAMQAILPTCDGHSFGPEPGNSNDRLAKCAYAVADAMLAARTK